MKELLEKKILILDGGFGTQIQASGITSADFEGYDGCNDYLCLTRGEAIAAIHRSYLEAGADIVSTNSFNANALSLREYGLEHKVYEINRRAAELARNEADNFEGRLVAGSVGPSSQSLSLSPDVEHPGKRSVTFNEMATSYAEQMRGLIDGGADMILCETFFDTLNAKAAIYALRQILGREQFPLMISGTITDRSGRTLSGQTVEAFYYSVRHGNPVTIGLNCAFGADQMRPFVDQLARIAECGISAHPNAGLPNVMGGYDETPEQMCKKVEAGYLAPSLVNIIGGCCGTTPEYIRGLAAIRDQYRPRPMPAANEDDNRLIVCGLEVLEVDEEKNFVNIGERTNVAGSAKFARLIREGQYSVAVEVAREQVEGGAQVIDVCMDAPMIDAVQAMTEFLNLIAAEPDIARLPVMIDSSDWNVVVAGLKTQQGRAIVNSISLKEGEEKFLAHARTIASFGAAAVVMLFDEQGQADTFERKIAIAARAYNLLTKSGFRGGDIIFDPNILAIATGIETHDRYALNFIEAVRWIKANCPGARVSGGVSNLSFSFRGNNAVREAMHSVFLFHATKAGMDMGIVNPSMLEFYDDIEPTLRDAIEDAVLCRSADAAEHLIDLATSYQSTTSDHTAATPDANIPLPPPEERVIEALKRGVTTTIEADTLECYARSGSAIDVIENTLMGAMSKIGELFGAGKMFLPQVVKSARVMKQAVAVLQPYVEQETAAKNANNTASARKKIVIATVKGDVHDIGKNIVALVLRCNNYDVVDLGVMVAPERIVEAAIEEKADLVCLSGLITPSLEEMRRVAEAFATAGLTTPIAVGGATTSALHTAVKIAPSYPEGIVVHSLDASDCVKTVSDLLASPDFTSTYRDKQQSLREKYAAQSVTIHPLSTARAAGAKQGHQSSQPKK